jgi:hypothetical protein
VAVKRVEGEAVERAWREVVPRELAASVVCGEWIGVRKALIADGLRSLLPATARDQRLRNAMCHETGR